MCVEQVPQVLLSLVLGALAVFARRTGGIALRHDRIIGQRVDEGGSWVSSLGHNM